MFSSHLRDCPWCELEHGGGPSFFSFTVASFEFDPGFDIDNLWKEVEKLTVVTDNILSSIRPPTPPPSHFRMRPTIPRHSGRLNLFPPCQCLTFFNSRSCLRSNRLLSLLIKAVDILPKMSLSFPDFTPTTLPPEQTLDNLPVPKPPTIRRRDHFGATQATSESVTQSLGISFGQMVFSFEHSLGGFPFFCRVAHPWSLRRPVGGCGFRFRLARTVGSEFADSSFATCKCLGSAGIGERTRVPYAFWPSRLAF